MTDIGQDPGAENRSGGMDRCEPYTLLRMKARSLFLSRGFHGISLRKLGDHMGVHAGSLYHYIKSKQALLFEIIEDYEASLAEAFFVVSNGTPRSRLLEFVSIYVNHLALNDESFQLASLEYRNLTEVQQAEIQNIRLAWQSRLEGILLDGVSLGDFECKNVSATSAGAIAVMNCLADRLGDPSIAIEVCQALIIRMAAKS
ncbi:TetR/AcrR family transcriptional regulator [Pseudomonas aeruginosa]|uniref:TetR/AcrR family transcriptional regulator n=1 Tax=Pseudomonas aeruginosa TaxID=287 RepID=UPI0021F0E548|nr:TetR/AcrR family transcriptional regulator [Pseudomonas aeruginosa]MCV6454933.1 TetR/AcrR family transcriptional regulator [Pseudomonas aeruginosa]